MVDQVEGLRALVWSTGELQEWLASLSAAELEAVEELAEALVDEAERDEWLALARHESGRAS
jgi:hypothetical protein